MSPIEAVLVFAGIPLAVVLLAIAVVAGGSRRARRYRPGRPFDFAPVWFLAGPEARERVGGHGAEDVHAGGGELGAAGEPAAPSPTATPGEAATKAGSGATGGASDRW